MDREIIDLPSAIRRILLQIHVAGEAGALSVIPSKESFPYSMLLTSECLESNGSTSMASTCGSTLALMDAGVPIKAPVSGIAMGMMSRDGKFEVLSDIQGMEDFSGDMDFKVAGTSEGITAIQLDTKVVGLTMEMVRKTLEQAKGGRAFILGEDAGDDAGGADGDQPVCAADHHAAHQSGEDWGGHRAGRQDDQGYRGGDGRAGEHRAGRDDLYCGGGRGGRREGGVDRARNHERRGGWVRTSRRR